MLTNPTSREAIEAAEKYADGHLDAEVLQTTFFAATSAARQARLSKAPGDTLAACAAECASARDQAMDLEGARRVAHHAADAVYSWTFHKAGTNDRAAFDAGNKAKETERLAQCDLLRCLFGNPFSPITLEASPLTTTIVQIAEDIYTERAFERMPVLADALEEGGVTNTEVLAHLRGPGPHARGCHVLDLILGKA
jgi:hypothetical protein